MEYTITRDFMGWAVCIIDNAKNIEQVKMGFHDRESAQKYAEGKKREYYRGSGVMGNEASL